MVAVGDADAKRLGQNRAKEEHGSLRKASEAF